MQVVVYPPVSHIHGWLLDVGNSHFLTDVCLFIRAGYNPSRKPHTFWDVKACQLIAIGVRK